MDKSEELQGNAEVEEWRPVKGHEGLYEVSSLLRVRSLSWIQQHVKIGEDHHAAKLNEEQVLEIRRRHAAGETAFSLHRKFKMSYTNAKDIVKRRTWTHI